MTVILINISAAFTFSPELEKDVSFLLDLPYEVPEDLIEFTKTAGLYLRNIEKAVASGYSIILLYSTPLVCEMLNQLRIKPDKPNASDWQVITFYHDDESLLNADINIEPASRINIKRNALLQFSEYPFIKKISIPYGHVITPAYLKKLLVELSD